MRHNLPRVTDDDGELLVGNVVMVSYHYKRFSSDADDLQPAPHPSTRGYSRYRERPMDWRTRLSGSSAQWRSWREVKPDKGSDQIAGGRIRRH